MQVTTTTCQYLTTCYHHTPVSHNLPSPQMLSHNAPSKQFRYPTIHYHRNHQSTTATTTISQLSITTDHYLTTTISQFTVAKKRNSIPPPLFTTSRYLATHLTASFYSFQSRPCTRSMFLHCKQGLPRDGFETGPQLQNFQLRSLRRDAKQKHEQGKRRQGHRCQGRTEMTRQEYAWTKRCWEKELPRKELSRGREVKGTRYQEKRLT